LFDWIGAHTRSFTFFGGVPAMLVSDNLRACITKACFYKPAVNRTYAEMAGHYNTACRRGLSGAGQSQGRSCGATGNALHHRQAAQPAVLPAIAELVAQINNRLSRHLGASRRALFEEIERSALKPLPAEPYVFAEWNECSGSITTSRSTPIPANASAAMLFKMWNGPYSPSPMLRGRCRRLERTIGVAKRR
jgi:hypothetical protein